MIKTTSNTSSITNKLCHSRVLELYVEVATREREWIPEVRWRIGAKEGREGREDWLTAQGVKVVDELTVLTRADCEWEALLVLSLSEGVRNDDG